MFAAIFTRAFSTSNHGSKISRLHKTKQKVFQVKEEQVSLTEKLGQLLENPSWEQIDDIQSVQTQLLTKHQKQGILEKKTRELEKEIKKHSGVSQEDLMRNKP
ncbi:MAG: hypothetical protein U1E78_00905 [Gammaproteobacteria bacterium]